jgi:hypothetical protein
MRLLRNILYFIIILLVLQVLKVFFGKRAFEPSYYIELIIGCAQFLVFFGAVYIFFFLRLSAKYFHFRKPVLASVLTGGILLILLEFSFGYLLYHPKKIPSLLQYSYEYYYDYFDADFLQFDEGKAVYDKDLFYTLKPNASFNFSNIEFSNHFSVNKLGLRDKDSSLVSPGIICLGDSYTMGWGVEEEESFPRQLEKLCGLKVLNTGVASYGTAREIMSLQRMDTSKLKYLVIQYCANDEDENESYVQNNYKLQISSLAVYNEAVKSQVWTRKYFPGKYSLVILQLFLKSHINKLHYFFQLHFDRNDKITDGKKRAEHFLDILCHSKIDFKKVKVVVTMLDTYSNMQNQFLDNIKILLTKDSYRSKFLNDIEIVDVSAALVKDDYYVLDKHIKKSGQQKIAKMIRDKIKNE